MPSPKPRHDEHIVLVDQHLDPDKMMFEGIDTSRQPLFTISEVAKVFFGRSAHWVRWRERRGFFVLDGEDIATSRTPGGARYYTLSDVEKIAHALASKDAIDGEQLYNALMMCRIEATIWDYKMGS